MYDPSNRELVIQTLNDMSEALRDVEDQLNNCVDECERAEIEKRSDCLIAVIKEAFKKK